MNKNVNEVVQKIAHKLNNTTAVCKKNYIDPYLIDLYINDNKRFYNSFKHATTKEELSEKYIELLRTK